MIARCIYCGFDVGTGLSCCGVRYNLNGTYDIPGMPAKRPTIPTDARHADAVRLLSYIKLGEGGLFVDMPSEGSARSDDYDWIVARDAFLAKEAGHGG